MALPTKPKRSLSQDLKSALLLKAMADNDSEEVTRIRMIDWEVDNIYPLSRFDKSGRHLLPKPRTIDGVVVAERLPVQRLRAVKDIVNRLMPIRRPRRVAFEGRAVRTEVAKDKAKDRSLIHRRQEWVYSSHNFTERRLFRYILLGMNATISDVQIASVKKELLGGEAAMHNIIHLLSWNKHKAGWERVS